MRSDQYRHLADERERQAAAAISPEVREQLLKIAASYRSLAENDEWLAGAPAPNMRSANGQGRRPE
jgi:hypothetical protein